MQKLAGNLLIVGVALALSLAGLEAIVRLKNASMTNYDIEMWRYAQQLKFPSDNPRLGHEHRPNQQAVLQSVIIRTNSWGLRGGPVSESASPGTRRILLIGSSIALGWGVAENDTLSAQLQRKFDAAGESVEVLNGGIGNYNAERAVERFLTRLSALRPSDIVYLAFVRDGEPLENGGGNWLLRHSELAVTLWIAGNRIIGATGESNLLRHYQDVYAPQSPGVTAMQAAFAKLADYAKTNHVRVTMAMVPDIHNLTHYPLAFVHGIFTGIAQHNGFAFIDLLPALSGLQPQEIFAMPGDPHPNARAHALMADAIFPVLSEHVTALGSGN
jgi:lysophospholipase L1-like esterase